MNSFDLLRQMIRDGQAGEPFARRLAIQCTRRISDAQDRARWHKRLAAALTIAELGRIVEDETAAADAIKVVEEIERRQDWR